MGDLLSLEAQAIWKVLLYGLLLGAGLPALFAGGIRAMAHGQGGDAEVRGGSAPPAPHPAGRAVGVACFAVVVLCVALGIAIIVASGFGKAVSFEHVYPVFTDKA